MPRYIPYPPAARKTAATNAPALKLNERCFRLKRGLVSGSVRRIFDHVRFAQIAVNKGTKMATPTFSKAAVVFRVVANAKLKAQNAVAPAKQINEEIISP